MKGFVVMLLLLTFAFLTSCKKGSNVGSSGIPEKSQKTFSPRSKCTVTISSGNPADIQNALTTAQSNGQDDVVCIEGTYTLTSTLTYEIQGNSQDCGKKLTIKAIGNGATLDGVGSYQILNIKMVSCGEDAQHGGISIEGIRFQNGNSTSWGGGLYITATKTSVTISNSIFSDNISNSEGGGVYVDCSYCQITLTGNTFNGNNAKESGGGVYVKSDQGQTTFANNTLNGNYAREGGGVMIITSSSELTLTNNTFSGNTSEIGGGVYIRSSYDLTTFTNNTFSNNTTTHGGGGALVVSYNGEVTFKNNTFSSNTSVEDGGGARIVSQKLVLAKNIFNGNRSQSDGGGVSINSGDIKFIDNTFSNNASVYGKGGGAYVESSFSITFTNNTFSNNNSGSDGGGAYVLPGSGLSIFTNNIFSANNSGDSAGGIYVHSESSPVIFTNNTFTNNHAKKYVGGVYVSLEDDTTTLHFYNNIIWNNTTSTDGYHGIDLYIDNDKNGNKIASRVNIAHNLFTYTEPTIDFSTPPQTKIVFIKLREKYNQNIVEGCIKSGNYGNMQVDPLFVDVKNGDFHLKQNSPAINKGCNKVQGLSNIDKDGNQRIWDNTVDIGAYEFGSKPPQQYTLKVNKSGKASGKIIAEGCDLACQGNTCTCTASAGTQITLSVKPDKDSVFAGWSGGTGSTASCTGTDHCTFILNANSSVTATFNQQQLPQLIIPPPAPP